MREFSAGSYDVAVIGAGHAGIEASLACARLGMKTVCFTINLDAVGNMPCNPAIGGTGKGHLVRELDALGGEMARAADLACIQYRMLNRGKGPAVWSLRAQADRRRYQSVMKHTLETQENLLLRQAEIVDLRVTDGHVSAVVTETGGVYAVGAVILCSGTFLDGRTIVGECVRESGPDGMHASLTLADALQKLGHRLTIGGGGGSHPAVDDRDGLQTADGDAVDAVRISSSIGILLAQRNPGLVQNRVRIAAEGTANRYVFTVGDDVAVLCKNDEGKRAGKDCGHCGDQQHTAKNTALCAFLSSAHQSNLLSD